MGVGDRIPTLFPNMACMITLQSNNTIALITKKTRNFTCFFILKYFFDIIVFFAMPSNYKRKPGSRKYQTQYMPETLATALREVENGSSVFKVSKKYKIPYGTLWNHAGKSSSTMYIK